MRSLIGNVFPPSTDDDIADGAPGQSKISGDDALRLRLPALPDRADQCRIQLCQSAAPAVHASRDGFEVKGIDASGIATEVVKFVTARNLAPMLDKRNPVSAIDAMLNPDGTVSLAILRANPFPAAGDAVNAKAVWRDGHISLRVIPPFRVSAIPRTKVDGHVRGTILPAIEDASALCTVEANPPVVQGKSFSVQFGDFRRHGISSRRPNYTTMAGAT